MFLSVKTNRVYWPGHKKTKHFVSTGSNFSKEERFSLLARNCK